MTGLSHFDHQGNAHMVDVSATPVTARVAVARGQVRMAAETLALITQGRARKGDVLASPVWRRSWRPRRPPI